MTLSNVFLVLMTVVVGTLVHLSISYNDDKTGTVSKIGTCGTNYCACLVNIHGRDERKMCKLPMLRDNVVCRDDYCKLQKEE